MSKTFPVTAPKSKLVIAGMIVTAIAAWYATHISQNQPYSKVEKAIKATVTAQIEKPAVTVAIPESWRSKALSKGVVSYTLSADDRAALEYDSVNDSLNVEHHKDPWLDGTRYPYVSDVAIGDLKQDSYNPYLYTWNGVWQGEGYNRVIDQNYELVAEREDGVDIELNVTWDKSITDITKPNLIITVRNHQHETAQLTNISAFWMDYETGETLDRIDFPQLPPVYEVTVSRNGGYAGTETKDLERSGTTTFAYHVAAGQQLPIRLTAVNQRFAEQQQEIADLREKGWVVKEVPAAGDS
jgi:hypothetical protein